MRLYGLELRLRALNMTLQVGELDEETGFLRISFRECDRRTEVAARRLSAVIDLQFASERAKSEVE
jgi:hypothetical protein